jgi:hypothetical protein
MRVHAIQTLLLGSVVLVHTVVSALLDVVLIHYVKVQICVVKLQDNHVLVKTAILMVLVVPTYCVRYVVILLQLQDKLDGVKILQLQH